MAFLRNTVALQPDLGDLLGAGCAENQYITRIHHLQTDRLVEKFNATLITMIAKSVSNRADWDIHLPHMHFACFIAGVYEGVPILLFDIDDYNSELTINLSEAWRLAQGNIHVVQKHQKAQYDWKTRDVNLKVDTGVIRLWC